MPSIMTHLLLIILWKKNCLTCESIDICVVVDKYVKIRVALYKIFQV